MLFFAISLFKHNFFSVFEQTWLGNLPLRAILVNFLFEKSLFYNCLAKHAGKFATAGDGDEFILKKITELKSNNTTLKNQKEHQLITKKANCLD